MKPLVVLCTWPADQDPLPAARSLVERRLAACVNVVPGLRSVYAWQGEIHTDAEILLLIKTSAQRYATLEDALRRLHPYELPEIVGIPIEKGLPGYLRWMMEQTDTSME
ncbi:MAG TPA: divalent-cation tolerance protein CutA [Chromatiales bacterium]|nr:divalent-cation tolerance protein CutA [Chromatiales bacterium]